MSTGSIAIHDFNLLAQSNSLKLDNVTVYYQYGDNRCYVSHCQINFDMYSSEWSISVIDNTYTDFQPSIIQYPFPCELLL